MSFLFKAVFWFCIVLLFLPVGAENMRGTRQLAEQSAQALVDTAHNAASVCVDHPLSCQRAAKVAAKTTSTASAYVAEAADKLAQAEGH